MKRTCIHPHPLSQFERRHQSDAHDADILSCIGVPSVAALMEEVIPPQIRHDQTTALPTACSEAALRVRLRAFGEKNKIYKQYIGLGYAETEPPAVIVRNVLESPAWYTAYTPYQAEISQGRLEALLYFQTLVIDLTGLPLAGASLLDEATAAAEAMAMCYRLRGKARVQAKELWVIGSVYPQTVAVLRGRAEQLGLRLRMISQHEIDKHPLNDNCFAVLVQYPDAEGSIMDYRAFFTEAQAQDVRCIACADLLSLTRLSPPGSWGADVVVGSTQRFGIPLGYGGPHAAYLATRTDYQRQMPGRLIGISKDSLGEPAYRMALQTREQHIRRERATSNICTAQVLLAIMAAFYAIYHGPAGLRHIATRIHQLTVTLARGLQALGFPPAHRHFFDTLKVPLTLTQVDKLRVLAEAAHYNFRYYQEENAVGITLGEQTQAEDIAIFLQLFSQVADKAGPQQIDVSTTEVFPPSLVRQTPYLTHPIFHNYQTEHELLRLIRRMEEKDLSLVHGMIPLGSCTMKLNASSEMQTLSWESFAGLHPFAPDEQAAGYHALVEELSEWLCQITGFAGISFQPNSGAQGEYAGLCVIKAYHLSRGDKARKLVLIPASAHGTNPASAHLAGLEVKVIPCDAAGNVEKKVLQEVAVAHKDRLAALMITYPSTHGVFEEDILELCDIIHQQGGQVYMDGANMNAQIGLTSPAHIGADVCHLNLHKTFCIPHGGGGPGMGPIAVAKHLLPYLPQHPLYVDEKSSGIAPVSAAPYGSTSLLPISYSYVALMGGAALRRASERAILHANYLKERLSKAGYTPLYTNKKGRVAHEVIIDCRPFGKVGVSVEDIAKRLIDYGFHAPTISFPVPGTMMIEPTESETLDELKRFCDALQGIRDEIADIAEGHAHPTNNLLKNAPHPATMLLSDTWDHPYSREEAAYPLPVLRKRKYWPPVGRVNNAAGDRNLQCSCPSISEYAEKATDYAKS